MIWDMLKGEFIDVIDWTDDTRDTMVWRFQRHGNAIKYGAKLTVREGQAAVFVHEGQLADVFRPGLYMLETNNMPVMTTLQHWDHLFQSPFKAEVYFVSTRRFQNLKWGTRNPIMLRDPEFGPVRLRAFGTYAIRVSDPGVFLREVVGTDGEVTTDEVQFQIRNVIVARFSNALASSGIPVLDLAASTDQMAEYLRARIAPELAGFGIEMPELFVENVSLPEAVEQALDRRTAMGVVGDLTKYAQFQAAEAMRAAAENPAQGGAMGAAIGAGMGVAMGSQMTAGPWGAIPQQPPVAAAPPPPPPAPETVWHIAENGQTTGPFSRADLGRMVAEGRFQRQTLVWSAGMEGWTAAGDVAALAQLFTIAPPPPPPPPAG
ncbi:SPFH domain-containing protein [Limibaculum sp. M0105]|uniref:SPFH domain-containing protein n=1 Tax=Thermohalobaculum xanthum TaxID=2753746 RepID=A0A8J7M8M6_9RHOB|nr:SPFH domain-containing protein [Thermohalobaculum xanthum]MBK0400624.1 SPFH domain-containing protein [Thermohalobaculum xanthum]